MAHLRTRIEKLESTSEATRHTGVLRIIQQGELSAAQATEIEAAKLAGKFIILRRIVQCPSLR